MHGRQLTALERIERRDENGEGFRWGRDYDVSDMVWWADWKKVGLPYCTIYVIGPIDGWPCKIGISTCALRRINSLQTSVWKQLEVKWCAWAPTVNAARKVEAQAHRTLTDMAKWLHGEWFDLRPDKAIELVQFEAELLGVPIETRLPDGPATEYVQDEWRYFFGSAEAQRQRIELNYNFRRWGR